jgi:L-cysteine S-thiosulfotransferase
MHCKNRNFFMSLCGSGRLVAGIAAVAFLAAAAVQATTADSIAAGKSLAMERSKGNCLACHRIEDGELPGTVGPPLLAMKLRFPERAVLKQQICDATIRNPDSRMPPFCRHGILTEDEVELIVEYLYTL